MSVLVAGDKAFILCNYFSAPPDCLSDPFNPITFGHLTYIRCNVRSAAGKER